MEDGRFDRIAKALGGERTRRGAFGLAAAAAGLALAEAEARQRKRANGNRRREGKHTKPASMSATCAAAGSKSCTVAQAKRGANLKNCDYAGADLAGKALNATTCSKASFAEADLHGANLAGASLGSACLAGANLAGAQLNGTNLSNADLAGANLKGANLRGSSVTADQLATAEVSCSTILPDGSTAACPAATPCCSGNGDCGGTSDDPANCGACGHACAADERCFGGVCNEVRLAFITDWGQNGDLGGLAGADASCNSLAAAAHLPGTYKAWLADASETPATRFTHASVPYVRTDGTVVANDWADLTSGSLRAQITLNAAGASVGSSYVWTNALPNGERRGTGNDCDGWRDGTYTIGVGPDGFYGANFNGLSDWSGWGTHIHCNSTPRFYCFQQ